MTRLALEMDISFNRAEHIMQDLVKSRHAEIDLEKSDAEGSLVYRDPVFDRAGLRKLKWLILTISRGSDRISCVNDRPYILDFRSVSTYSFETVRCADRLRPDCKTVSLTNFSRAC